MTCIHYKKIFMYDMHLSKKKKNKKKKQQQQKTNGNQVKNDKINKRVWLSDYQL